MSTELLETYRGFKETYYRRNCALVTYQKNDTAVTQLPCFRKLFGFAVVGDGYPNRLFSPLPTGVCRGRFISISRPLPKDFRLCVSYAQLFS